MSLFAMLFPGHGSQHIGMLSSFFNHKNNNIFKSTFDEASQYLRYNLLQLIKEGPIKKLNQSQYTQPAVMTSSVSIYRFWRSMNGKSPSFMAGHSLGEYSALVCSRSIKFSDALKIVSLRGKLMQKIAEKKPFLMHAIIGIDKKIVENICSIVSNKKIASLASINSNKQIVISGDQSTVNTVSLICKQHGAKYILDLNIKIPTHCILMKPIVKKIKRMLKIITIKSPKTPVIHNFHVKSENISKNIKNALVKQIYNTVRWKETIESIISKKIFTTVEIGPDKILTNLNKNNKNTNAFSTNNLKNFLIAFKQVNK